MSLVEEQLKTNIKAIIIAQEHTSSLLSILPIEIIYLIIEKISDPKTFQSTNQTCKLFNQICRDPKIQNNAKEKMKRKIITKIFILTQEYFILPNGSKHGEFKSRYHNGQLRRHYFYKDNKLEGECKEWHRNGQLRRHYFYKDNKLEGKSIEWDRNGQLREHNKEIEEYFQ